MKDLIQEAFDKGIPVIDNTKDAAYYRDERAKRDAENIAKHVFVENIEQGMCSIDPETNAVRRRISFDFIFLQQEALLNERNEANEELFKKTLSEQLLKTVHPH